MIIKMFAKIPFLCDFHEPAENHIARQSQFKITAMHITVEYKGNL